MNHRYLFYLLVALVALLHSSSGSGQQDNSQQKPGTEVAQSELKQPELSEAQKKELMAKVSDLGQRAMAAKQAGRFDEALKLLDQIVEFIAQDSGTTNPDLLSVLNLQGNIATGTNQFDKAVAARERALKIGRSRYPGNSYKLRDLEIALANSKKMATLSTDERNELASANTLNAQSFKQFRSGDIHNALKSALEVKAVREKVLGKDHLEYATCLNYLAWIYSSTADYVRAERFFLEAQAIYIELIGEEHPEYASCLNNLASMYYSKADYARAEPYYLEAKDIYERVLGKEHPDYATSLSNLAGVYRSIGDYSRAEPLYMEAIAIEQKVLGKKNPDYARTLNSFALLSYSVANYARAEQLFVEAIEIQEKALGKGNPTYASTLFNLAGLYRSIGEYARAEPLYLDAKAIKEKVHGKEHPEYAICLNHVAVLYHDMGDHARAESLYLEAKAIQEKVLGKANVEYATTLSNLAGCYHDMGDYARAEPLFFEVKAICEKIGGKKHSIYAISLRKLGRLFRSMGDYARAESLCLESKVIQEEVLGKKHPDYAITLSDLAHLYFNKADFAQAELYHLEAKAVCETALGKEHPAYATSLNNLAAVYAVTADYSRAEPLYDECLAITRKHIEATAIIQTERQQMVMDQSLRCRLDNYLAMASAALTPPKNAVANSVLWKGSVMRRLRGLRVASDDPSISEQYSKLQSVTAHFSNVAQQTPAPEHATKWRERLAALTAEKEALEKLLIRSSAAIAKAVKPITLTDIQLAIPSDGVLVDYLEFYAGKNGRQLLASIVRPNAEPRMVLLGSVGDLQAQVDAWRKSFVEEQSIDEVTGNKAGQAIRKQIWEPLVEHLGDAKTVLVSTDGVLGRLPLGALPGKQPGTYLIEDHRLVLLPVPQLLPALMEKPADRQMLREMLLIGDVDYQADSNSTQPVDTTVPAPRKRPWERSEGMNKVLGSAQWAPLAETGREVEFIGGMYKRLFKPKPESIVELRKGQATETAFRQQAPGSTYLHLATHGFFAAPDKQSALSGELVTKHGEDRGMAVENRNIVRGFSPGQLSGLVFAGANRPAESVDDSAPTPETSPRSGEKGDANTQNSNFKFQTSFDDGILTADEIAFMRLEGTRLVVLSACETGLGEVAGGEGLLGIQRGFQLAGARSTVASLWKVNDGATRRLMEEFYTNYLEREMSMLDALREAQLWALNHPGDIPRGAPVSLPNAKVVDREKPHRLPPRYWAAFVLSGDWR